MSNNDLNKLKEKPDLKMDKIKMDNIEEIEELNVDYSEVEPQIVNKHKIKKGEHYPETHYATIKEIYLHSMKKFANCPCILDKSDPKDAKYKEYTFREFGDDVEALGTALTKKYGSEENRIVIIGENQYAWYVSY